MEISGFKEREDFEVIHKLSYDALLDFIKERIYFDVIYIDGSHKLLDSYLDIELVWRCLNINGIFIIDDVLFNKDDVLNSPYEGVELFLQKHKNEYNLIHRDYRVYLQKMKM